LLEADDDDGKEEDDQGKRQTGRVRVPPQSWQHLQARDEDTKEYSLESAQIVAMTMVQYNTALAGMNDVQASSFLQTYSLKQGIKKFGKQGIAAVHKEMKQIHDRVVFEPISIEEMTKLEKKIMYYKKFRKDIESIGFEVNPYDICVTDRKFYGKQQTVTWHVDDLKSSHVDSKVNDEFAEWCEETYGSEDLGHVKVS
jgi:hypothetical protein